MDDEKLTPARGTPPDADVGPGGGSDIEADVEDDVEAGGDPACWAALVCPNCGAIPDRALDAAPGGERHCPNCGESYPSD